MKRQRKTHVTGTAPTAVPGALLLLAAVFSPLKSTQDEVPRRNRVVEERPLNFELGEAPLKAKATPVWNLPRDWNAGAPRREWTYLDREARGEMQKAAPGRWREYELCVSDDAGQSPKAWERYHSDVLGIHGGCAWHIMIQRDGSVNVSARWDRQEDAEVAGTIRICFLAEEKEGPSDAQWRAADEVLDYLETRTGRLSERPEDGAMKEFSLSRHP